MTGKGWGQNRKRERGGEIYRQIYIHTKRQMDREIDMKEKQTDRQTDIQTDKERESNFHEYIFFFYLPK